MARKKQSKRQIKMGKKYQWLKDTNKIIGDIIPNLDRKKGGKYIMFTLKERTRAERKISFKKMMKYW